MFQAMGQAMASKDTNLQEVMTNALGMMEGMGMMLADFNSVSNATRKAVQASGSNTDQTMAGVMGMMGNFMVLAERVKQDSDLMRSYTLNSRVTNPRSVNSSFDADKLIAAWKAKLGTPNASPVIAIHNVGKRLGVELDEMNYSMGVMATSMGSTMGRMGNSMSSMPFP